MGDALVALAVVVGTDVEDGVILAVVPANEFVVLFHEREERVAASILQLASLLNLGQQPRTADDGVGLQQFERRRGRHLAGDDAGQVALDRQFVDGCDAVAFYDES